MNKSLEFDCHRGHKNHRGFCGKFGWRDHASPEHNHDCNFDGHRRGRSPSFSRHCGNGSPDRHHGHNHEIHYYPVMHHHRGMHHNRMHFGMHRHHGMHHHRKNHYHGMHHQRMNPYGMDRHEMHHHCGMHNRRMNYHHGMHHQGMNHHGRNCHEFGGHHDSQNRRSHSHHKECGKSRANNFHGRKSCETSKSV